MRESFSEAEVARGLPVWTALADLFLDTDVMLFVPTIARTIAESDYSVEEAEAILRWEVRPAFYRNLLDVAGEWAGWHPEIVREEVLANKARIANRILLGSDRFMPNEEWAAVVVEVRRLRSLAGPNAN